MRIPIPIAILIRISAVLLPVVLQAQAVKPDTTTGAFKSPNDVSEKSLSYINKKYTGLTDAVDQQTIKVLGRMQRREARLQKRVQCVDSSKAKLLFDGTQAKYQNLQAKLQSPVNSASTVVTNAKQYIAGIDSMGTLMRYLSANNPAIGGAADKLAQIQNISDQVQQLQGRMQQASEAEALMQQRQQQLQSQLSGYSGIGSQLLGMNKTVYYYQAQIAQYKAMINDRQQLEQAVFTQVQQLPAFQSFWQKYSILAQLFPMPQGYGTPAALAGLQTRAQVQGAIMQQLPSIGGGTDPTQFLQQQFQQAQSQLSALKDKVSQLGNGPAMGGGSGGSATSDIVVPDFSVNTQHNKSFLKRLTYGYNFQTTPPTAPMPAVCAIGLSLGYKLSDKATIGIGTSYLLGLGNGFSHIAFTNQGVGLRSFGDWKIPDIKGKGWAWLGGLWIAGGYEYNYMQQFAKFTDLRNIDVWQKSALLGMEKKYTVGKHEADMQLLYDFLASQEIPRGQQVVFRFGYNF